MPNAFVRATAIAAVLFVGACHESEPQNTVPERTVYSLANGCFALAAHTSTGERFLAPTSDGTSFAFSSATAADASHFVMRAADLGTFILRDAVANYPTGEATGLARTDTLLSDTVLNYDAYVSPAEWDVTAAPSDARRFSLRNRATSKFLAATGLASAESSSTAIAMVETTGCTPFPELSLDATGTPTQTHFDDGDLFGFVDAHSHTFTNFSFGGGGIFHGAPFHRLGVEQALPDCEPLHGFEGRRDIIGYFYGASGPLDFEQATNILFTGEVPFFNHFTAGYPDFTEWPNPAHNSTHQTEYYRWLERAYLGGLRLMVQHATSNEVLCELAAGAHSQDPRFSCNEMVSVDRIINETRALERYVDAQHGGPGLGWYRVVSTPAEARAVIAAGKMAVILGIETSNPLDCFLTPHANIPSCDPATVVARLDSLYDRGIRALFPVHKFDNAFSAGDGHRGFIEVGNIANSGYYSNFTTDCDLTVPAPFDHGPVQYGGLNMPRAVYDAPPPIDISGFELAPASVFYPLLDAFAQPSLPGEHCQSTGLTPLGETLILEMMKRGMIVEIDHLPKRAYARAVEMLMENDYPGAGTHSSTANGVLFELGGISATGLPRCGNPADPTAAGAGYRARIAEMVSHGGYPAQGFAFDMNGFAGVPGPRFGPQAGCGGPAQINPITYPFTSYAGDVEFQQPSIGNRVLDFNTEGLVTIGLVPELVQDARNMGMTDAELEPLFRSAEGYLRMWERAELRSAAVRAAHP